MRKLVLMVVWLALCCVTQAQYKKAVSILGDSYSTYEGFLQPDTNLTWYWKVTRTQATDVASVRETWWHRFITENNCRLCVNNSYSSTTICNTGYRKEDFSDRSFITRMTALGCPDIIFVFGGTNDAWAGSPIGEYKYADWTKEELYTFRPAMAYLLAGLQEHYPNVDIYVLLNDGLGETIPESVKTVCARYGIDCIELKGIDKKSGHPTVKGMKQICDQVTGYLEKAGKLP